jgi:ketosteroid isomerase-like protein
MNDLELVESIYQAFEAKDLDAVLAVCHPDCVVTQDDRLPWGGRYEGHDGAATFFVTLVSTTDSTLVPLALFSADGVVIQYGRTKGTVRATGAEFDVPEVHRWTVRDGKVAEAHFAIDTPAMLAALAAQA